MSSQYKIKAKQQTLELLPYCGNSLPEMIYLSGTLSFVSAEKGKHSKWTGNSLGHKNGKSNLSIELYFSVA